jgi:hypothetical protein
MNEHDRSGLPQRRGPDAGLPARHLTTEQLEAVIRRAVELQSGPDSREEGVSEAEVVRIGQELGLQPAAVRRAIAEVRSGTPGGRGALDRGMGPGAARASRVLPRTAADVDRVVATYLRDCEIMVVQRRFGDRTRYVRDSSFGAGVTRIARGLTRRGQTVDLKQLDVAVSPVDERSCFIEVSVDLAVVRAGLAAGAIGGGGGAAAGIAAAAWATPIADPFMLLGIPVLAAFWYGSRAIYGVARRSTQEKLESFLDRLEHNELPVK